MRLLLLFYYAFVFHWLLHTFGTFLHYFGTNLFFCILRQKIFRYWNVSSSKQSTVVTTDRLFVAFAHDFQFGFSFLPSAHIKLSSYCSNVKFLVPPTVKLSNFWVVLQQVTNLGWNKLCTICCISTTAFFHGCRSGSRITSFHSFMFMHLFVNVACILPPSGFVIKSAKLSDDFICTNFIC